MHPPLRRVCISEINLPSCKKRPPFQNVPPNTDVLLLMDHSFLSPCVLRFPSVHSFDRAVSSTRFLQPRFLRPRRARILSGQKQINTRYIPQCSQLTNVVFLMISRSRFVLPHNSHRFCLSYSHILTKYKNSPPSKVTSRAYSSSSCGGRLPRGPRASESCMLTATASRRRG